MKDGKGRKITLGSGKQYLIIEQCTYNDKTYCFACEMENNSPTENFKVLSIEVENDKKKVKIITDDDIIKAVCKEIDEKTE